MGKHLTQSDRISIETMFKAKTSVKTMAQVIGCSTRTIYRELERGQCKLLNGSTYEFYTSYSAVISQKKHDELAEHNMGRPLKLAAADGLPEFLEDYIGQRHYSPAAALQEIELQGLEIPSVSVTTLYRYIYRCYFKFRAIDLPVGRYHCRKQQEQYISQKHSHDKSISQRPAAAESREQAGHWEMDTVIGTKTKGPCLLVLTERKTRFEIIKLMNSKSVRETIRCLQEVKSEYGPAFQEVFKSITCDNGCEFDTAVDLEQFAPVYYCHPYSSWERGSNENQNKLIRRFCPKGKSMANLTSAHAEYLSLWMNNYPRKLLGWKRPADLFRAEFAALGIKIPA